MSHIADTATWLADPVRWAGNAGIPARLVQHLSITLAAILIASLIALPLGVLIGHTRRGAGWIGALTGAARAVPTLGLLTIFGLAIGIGIQAPLLALVILAVPSLLAGGYAGVQAVDPGVVDAARAVGMSTPQLIRRVELPLASPMILGGLRTATLQVVSTATLAAYISDYGLGRYMFTGLKSHDYPQMLAGALLVIAVALLLELILATSQRLARRYIADPAVSTTSCSTP